MKKVGFILFLVLMLNVPVMAFAADNTKGEIKFEQTIYDFGNIKEDGGKVSHEFVFKNEGTEPLKILEARAECGCTTPEYPKEEIAPGEQGIVKVTYNPLGRPGGFTKVVRLKCTGNPGKINLKIRGTVTPK